MTTSILQGILLVVTVAVILVNGWTDAPNAIASAVSTGALSYGKAVRLAAVCNLLGIVVMSLVSTSVADTMVSMARLDPARPDRSMACLCAAMAAIVMFAVAAWVFGIPTSESHGLIAALSGAAVALGGWESIDGGAWGKVLWGLLISVALGMGLGALMTVMFSPALRRLSHRSLDRFQTVAAGAMAFLHGAQDGQKFIAVLVIVNLLARGAYTPGPVNIREHWLAMLFCGAAMALGTAMGGKRIIATVGEKMAPLSREQGVCADLAGGICLLLASLTGIPMSTTHTKTTAIMGTGIAVNERRINYFVIRNMFIAWMITFPVCGLLGFGLTRLLLALL